MPDLSWFHSALLLSCLGMLALSQPIILHPLHLYASSHAAEGKAHPDSLRGELVQTPSVLKEALALRNDEVLMWGSAKSPSGESQVALMQLETLDEEKASRYVLAKFVPRSLLTSDRPYTPFQVINMQRFSHLLSKVNCAPAQVTLRFGTQAALDVAYKTWSIVNSDEISHITLFTNWKGCYTNGGNLKPFHITKVSLDSKKLTATLIGSEKEWKVAAHTFSMSIGKHFDETHATADGSSRPLLTRSSIFTKAEKEIKKDFNLAAKPIEGIESKIIEGKSIEGVWSRVRKGIKKGFKAKLVDIDRDILHIHLDKSYTGTQNISGNAASLDGSVTCTACGVHGKLVFRAIVNVKLGEEPTMKLAMRTHNLGVRLGLAMNAKSDISDSFSTSHPLFDSTLPGFGVKIPELTTIGLTASLEYGISLSNFEGDLNIAKNLSVSIPNAAELELSVVPSEAQSTLQGNWAPVSHSAPMHSSGFGSGGFAVGLSLSLSLKMEVLSVEITPIKVAFGGPSVAFEFGVASKGSGPCASSISSRSPTYYITPTIGFSLSVGSELSLGSGRWGLGIPIPASGGPNQNSSQETGGSGGGGSGTNPPHPSSTHTNPDQEDSFHPPVETRSVTKRHNYDDPIGASKMSIGVSKTLFERNFLLHKPICFTSEHHHRRLSSNNGPKDEPDGGPR